MTPALLVCIPHNFVYMSHSNGFKMLIPTSFEMYRIFVKLPDGSGHLLPYETDLWH